MDKLPPRSPDQPYPDDVVEICAVEYSDTGGYHDYQVVFLQNEVYHYLFMTGSDIVYYKTREHPTVYRGDIVYPDHVVIEVVRQWSRNSVENFHLITEELWTKTYPALTLLLL